MSNDDIHIRQATPGDCEAIAVILDEYAREEVLLWRTRDDIMARIAKFLVAESGDEVVGCVALHPYGNGLYEIRSLAVEKQWTGKRIGSLLTTASVEHARDENGIRVFALTRKVDFFLRCGFEISDKNFFPQKVWADCATCHKRDRCDETAVHVDL